METLWSDCIPYASNKFIFNKQMLEFNKRIWTTKKNEQNIHCKPFIANNQPFSFHMFRSFTGNGRISQNKY